MKMTDRDGSKFVKRNNNDLPTYSTKMFLALSSEFRACS